MIQGSYLSTYRTYKAGTKRLATWLVQAAKLCGIDSTSSATDKYQISLAKFVELAETITKSKVPKIKVPQEIIVGSFRGGAGTAVVIVDVTGLDRWCRELQERAFAHTYFSVYEFG
jgi:hypothetical protein